MTRPVYLHLAFSCKDQLGDNTLSELELLGSFTTDFEVTSHGLDFESRFKRTAYDSVVAEVSAQRKTGPFSLRTMMDHNYRITGNPLD